MCTTVHRAIVVCLYLAFATAPIGAAAQDLTLEAALQLTIERGPRLDALREAHLATSGRRLEAAARPNPELSFEVENVRFGNGPGLSTIVTDPGGTMLERSLEGVSDAGFAGSELTLSVSQKIELGGKRSRRIAMADREIAAALWDYEIARAEELARTRRLFVEALAAQEAHKLQGRLEALAADAASAVATRVEAGKDSPIQHERAQVEHAQTRIALAAAERRITASRYALAAQWGQLQPGFETVTGDLFGIQAPPDRESLRSLLEDSPEFGRWAEEVALREAGVALARSQRAPDLNVNLGWRGNGVPEGSAQTFDAGGTLVNVARTRPGDTWDHSLVFGASIPLPLFSRNRGRLVEAEHLAAKASHELRAARSQAFSFVAAVHAEIEAAHAEVVELRDVVLPAAERAYTATLIGFEAGKFPFLDTLDAQRTLFNVESQHIDALANYHRGIAELERLIGAPISAGWDRAGGRSP